MDVDREDVEAIARAVRKGTHSETFGDQLDEVFDPSSPEDRKAHRRTPTGRAEASVARLLAEQDGRLTAEEFDIELDEDGQPLVAEDAESLSEQIDELQAQVNASAADPAQFEILSHRLGQLKTRKATIAVQDLMQEQHERRVDEEDERQEALEDDDSDSYIDTETF